jgi:hypothetical protein
MAICGFCKQEVALKGYLRESPPTKAVRVESQEWADMFSCPHCKAVLGFMRRA